MITFPMVPGVEINVFLLLFLGLAVGVVSGFTGVGGGFIMSPTLIVMGFPAEYAVGTSLMWVMGNAIVGAFRHRQLGNIDIKLALFLMVFVMGGIEAGVRILGLAKHAGLANEAVLAISILVLFLVGGYTFFESSRTKKRLDNAAAPDRGNAAAFEKAVLHAPVERIKLPPVIFFPKSGIRVSLWVLLVIGAGTGVLSGFIGVGGGFIMVPSMVYLLGVPSFIAVGTDMFQIIFSSAFGSIQHTISGNVIIFAAFIILLGSAIGVYFGAQVTKYLRGLCMRYILAGTIFVALAGSVIKLITFAADYTGPWAGYGTLAVMLGGMGLVLLALAGLFTAALCYQKGKHVPAWMLSLLNC